MAFLKKDSTGLTRRDFLRPLAVGTAAAVVGGVPGVYGFFKWLMAKPEPMPDQPTQIDQTKSKHRVQDRDFQKFRDMFEKGPMSYQDAAAYIKQKTGIEIERHDSRIPDPLQLTTAKAFYLFQLISLDSPKGLEKQLGFSQMNVSVTNGIVYKTHNYSNDGRVMALADYILTKQKPGTAREAASFLANWVCDNIGIDFRNITTSPIYSPSKDGGTGEEWRISRGIGTSNSFSNGIDVIRKGGVCYDLSNLLTDLQNSVGIPSRSIHLIMHGITRIAGNPVLSSYSHSLVQTSLGNGVYYCDPMPAYDPVKGVIYDAFAYTSLEQLVRLHMKKQNTEIYYFGITGAVTQDKIPDELRGILLNDPFNFANPEFLRAYAVFLEQERRTQPNPENRQLIHLYTRTQTESETKISF